MGNKIVLLLVLGLALAGLRDARADELHPSAATPTVPSWGKFVDGLRDLGPQMVAKLPQRLRNDPQVRQEVGQLMLEALAGATLEAIAADGDHPTFLPTLNIVLNVYQPNADTIYRSAVISPGGTYHIRGYAGSLRIFNLMEVGARPTQFGSGGRGLAFHDFNALKHDKDGRFDVILSPQRPKRYEGEWWQLDPTTSSLGLRQVAGNWATERDPKIAIERLDKPVERPRPGEAELLARLEHLATATANTAKFFVDHVEGLRYQGYINKLKTFDVAAFGGLAGQYYYEGAYDLKPDEALIVEAKVPDKCRYASIILTNDLYETTDWYNNQSSLNDSQFRVDGDGVLRVVVSKQDPGVPNWLDTSGYLTGAVQGRWTGCTSTPVPEVRKVSISEIRKLLPPDTPLVTPQERDRQVRDRRALLQQRPLW